MLSAWMGSPWPGRRCSTCSDRRRAAVLSEATSWTVSGASRAVPRMVMTASPESWVGASLCQNATLSSVWPGVLITVHADAPAMKANVGDWLVIKGTTTERSDQRGLITEVHSAGGAPPYGVRWLATGNEATVFPGSDAIVVTQEGQEQADERARARLTAVQSATTHPTSKYVDPSDAAEFLRSVMRS